MPAPRTSRLLVLIAVAALLVGAGCRTNNDDDDIDATTPPEETPSVESVADFQLVGRIDESFAGQLPPVDLPEEELDLDADATPSPGTSPLATPVGTTPTQGGILRLILEDASPDLRQACGLEEDDVVQVYWTTNTFFEPGDVLDDVEDEIEDRIAAIVGKIFRSSGAADTDTEATATPEGTASPAETGTPSAQVEATDCLLVAEQIGFTRTTLPTPRAAVRRTAAPTPVRTASPTPAPTDTATPEATETEEPEPEPTDTDTATP